VKKDTLLTSEEAGFAGAAAAFSAFFSSFSRCFARRFLKGEIKLREKTKKALGTIAQR
jgi:hypothetical protein